MEWIRKDDYTLVLKDYNIEIRRPGAPGADPVDERNSDERFLLFADGIYEGGYLTLEAAKYQGEFRADEIGEFLGKE